MDSACSAQVQFRGLKAQEPFSMHVKECRPPSCQGFCAHSVSPCRNKIRGTPLLPGMVVDARHRRRRIDLKRFCRQYMHRASGESAAVVRGAHSTMSATVAAMLLLAGARGMNGAGATSFMSMFAITGRKGQACKWNPECKFLHVTLRGTGGPPQPLQVQLVPRAVEDPEQPRDPVDEEEVSLEPEESQLTAGAAARFGYLGFGDSDVENDTDGEHSEDLEEVREEQAEREPAAARQRAVKPPQRSTTTVAGEYRPPAPVRRRKPEGRRKGQAALPDRAWDTNVRHRWMVTCRRCKKQIMKVFNHREVQKHEKIKVFRYRMLRGFWLKQANGQLFGRVGLQGTQKRLSCQKRLPGDWDVSRASDRRIERRILKGQLLKYNFQFHAGEECAPNAPEMRFEEQCGLKRRIDGVPAEDEGGYDDDEDAGDKALAPDVNESEDSDDQMIIRLVR